MVEEKLELFVSQIDAELLKSVHSEVLKTKDVKDSCKYRKSKPQMSHNFDKKLCFGFPSDCHKIKGIFQTATEKWMKKIKMQFSITNMTFNNKPESVEQLQACYI